ncbi:MAG TPA: DUF3574 domain-containing protein [Lysobacter sp.]|nr:DUF3574 domain-containing protein [Lysobacter sp.]
MKHPQLMAALALAMSACASLPPTGCAAGEQPMVSEMLYFGTQTPDGAVTPEQWAQFLATVVTPRFPRGLTVWPAAGQWRSADGSITREASYALNLLHADNATNEAAIRAIVGDYKTRFRQEAVLRVKSRGCASF